MSDSRERAAIREAEARYPDPEVGSRVDAVNKRLAFEDGAEWQSTRDTSPAPASVTDEERRALLKKALGEAMIGSRGGLTWEGGYARGWDDFKAAVGPALARLEALREFAVALMHERYGDLDGGQLQDLAVKHGLLTPVEVTDVCGAACVCNEYGDFPQTCYRFSSVLTGSDAEKGKSE